MVQMWRMVLPRVVLTLSMAQPGAAVLVSGGPSQQPSLGVGFRGTAVFVHNDENQNENNSDTDTDTDADADHCHEND
eukprot:3468610-Rhodomonas_salina.2